MVCVENMIQASYDTFYVKIFFSFLSFLIDSEVMGKASVVNVLSIWEIQLNSDETFYNVEAMASWGDLMHFLHFGQLSI